MKSMFVFVAVLSVLVTIVSAQGNYQEQWSGDYDASTGHYDRNTTTTVTGDTQTGGNFQETTTRRENGYSSTSPMNQSGSGYNSYPAYQYRGYPNSSCRDSYAYCHPAYCYPRRSWLAALFDWDVYVCVDDITVVSPAPVCWETIYTPAPVVTYGLSYGWSWGGNNWDGNGGQVNKTVNKTVNKNIMINKTVNITRDVNRNVAPPQSRPAPEKKIRLPKSNQRRDVAVNQVVHRQREVSSQPRQQGQQKQNRHQ